MGEEKTMRLFGQSNQAVKKWRMRALFVDLHQTRVTICESTQKHVPPWVYRQLLSRDK